MCYSSSTMCMALDKYFVGETKEAGEVPEESRFQWKQIQIFVWGHERAFYDVPRIKI